MQKELIHELIAHARDSADNAFCPYSGVPVGASLLTADHTFLGGCNIEPNDIGSAIAAGESVIFRALCDGITGFTALCLWSEKTLPYPGGRELSLINQFAPDATIIIANDSTYMMHRAHELLPMRRIYADE